MHANRPEPVKSAPRAEQELVRLRMQLAEAQHQNAALQRRLDEALAREQDHGLDRLKADFLNTASHELRTPLTSIKGYAEFLEDGVGGALTPEQLGYVQQIQLGTQRLRRIVDDMLDFARLEAGTFQLQPLKTDLARLVASEAASLAPQAHAKAISIDACVHPRETEPLAGHFDPVRVGQVILNLVGNAIKFTPAGGRIELEAGRHDGTLFVEVRDTGIGIPAELHERVFAKFFQVDPTSTREQGGAGLGLAISRALVEAHGGTLDVASRPGEGATFRFTLPNA